MIVCSHFHRYSRIPIGAHLCFTDKQFVLELSTIRVVHHHTSQPPDRGIYEALKEVANSLATHDNLLEFGCIYQPPDTIRIQVQPLNGKQNPSLLLLVQRVMFSKHCQICLKGSAECLCRSSKSDFLQHCPLIHVWLIKECFFVL